MKDPFICTMSTGSVMFGNPAVLAVLTNGTFTPSVTGFFSDIFPSYRTMALVSTQPPSENEYQEHFLGVKAAGA
jgi:hypothetical protein